MNNGTAACTATVVLRGWPAAPTANVTLLTADSLTAANPPGDPTRISPTSRSVKWAKAGGKVRLPPRSVATVAVLRAG